ncbi:MATE family efflux transporter [Paucibacter sp. APW11]|uniref:Multidrug-efflux transporter n=1 Tax=Roseateles aquae TaxID=3077235 RepID=A0ABU3P9L8_9BURK|nr:MATE family efflux transporter [Paucibacter sp. APW11]MDT8998925.1 MATE family efflux transporter [Paucibacter sp. APW11]
MSAGHFDSLRRLLPLAWPVFIGQIAVLSYSTVDTVLVARASANDLAALSVGSAVFFTVFIGLMGIVLAISPVVGQLFGAGKLREAGDELHQTVWLALALTVLGEALLLFPGPLLDIARVGPEVEARVRGYLLAQAAALPASLLFTAYRGFNTAVSRPKAVMVLQVGGLALKLPLSLLLVQGVSALGLPPMGAVGCGIATAIVMWSQALVAAVLLRRDPFYAQFGLQEGGLHRPRLQALKQLLKLGLPMGGAILIEVTGFTFMAIFIARLGATPVAGHQLAVNLIALMFMMPMALGNAAGTLVAQSLGAHRHAEARRLGWHSLEIGMALAFVLGGLVFFAREPVLRLYTDDASILAAAMPLLLWVWLFHLGDAGQTIAAFVLRAHHIATAPMLIYALAVAGLGLGGGFALAFGHLPALPQDWQGAPGFWIAATAGLVSAALLLSGLLAYVHRIEARENRRDALPAGAEH